MGLNITKLGPNEWRLDVRVWNGGNELRKREVFYGYRPQAQERFFEIKRDLKAGKPPAPPTPPLQTFSDVLALHKQRRESLGKVDRARYRSLERDMGGVPLAEFPQKFHAYLTRLRTMPSESTGKPLANATLNRFLAMARTAYTLAVDLELLEKSPLSKARFPKLREVPRDRILSPEETSRLLDTMAREAPHILPMTLYALQVPCRKSELINMRRGDLDLVSKSIRVRNGTTKNDRGCDKPIPPDMVDYFRSLPQETEYLFYREEGGRYHTLGCFNKSWYKCLKLADIRDFRFHDTRHIAATTLLDNGTPEQVVMTVAGWKTNMLQTYYHRDGKKSLSLIRFGAGSGRHLDAAR